MDRKAHWENVYATKRSDAVSWYQPTPVRSLQLIESVGIGRNSSIIDVGGGDSTLADALLARGVGYVTVVDISGQALDRARRRLGERAEDIVWVEGDVTAMELPPGAFDIWHDRAVFHFLVDAGDRERYVRAASDAVKPGGALIVATFAADGPAQCSGLAVMRYAPSGLAAAFAPAFELETAVTDEHVTPSGASQRFTYVVLRRRVHTVQR